MQKRSALRWILPAVIILLLHTLVPHSHGWMNTEIKAAQTTCNHHHHGVWEFFTHLLTQDFGVEHLENYQVADVDFQKKNLDFNIIFITNNLSHFHPLEISKIINKIIPQNDFFFPKNRLFTEISFRGPPNLV
ncbi:MAG: hypothetical protein HC803_04605 [Saprospiraceae bacterium]|nr:hypothetical protein [Saprospiraceae bacterium]